MENTATSRQRWALYCITKKDYRNVILSKEEAAKLISELGDSNYKKKTSKKSLKDELLEFMDAEMDDIFKGAIQTFKSPAIVTVESEGKSRDFAMFGICAYVWLQFDKRSKKGKEIDKLAKEVRNDEVLKMFLKRFTKEERNYYKNIGTPLEALWFQEENMQLNYFYAVRKFMESKGVKNVMVNSRLD